MQVVRVGFGHPDAMAMITAVQGEYVLRYGGEHYVLDVVLGWAYAVVVYAAVTGIEMIRGREAGASALELSSSRVRA